MITFYSIDCNELSTLSSYDKTVNNLFDSVYDLDDVGHFDADDIQMNGTFCINMKFSQQKIVFVCLHLNVYFSYW